MRLYHRLIPILYAIVLLLFSLYSYALIDPNLTLIKTSWWEAFRNQMVYFGYYRRDISSVIYITFVIILFIFHLWFSKKYKNYSPLKIAFIVGLILLISYPFLSHDFFNYLFDAKILTWYHQNPYFHKALDFPKDPWLRFTQWTERSYPYGPLFLALTALPSFLSMGKFILDFFLLKLFFSLFFFLSVFYLNRLNKRWAIIFATHPLILIEGLVSTHNDLLGLALAVLEFIWH